MSTPAKASYPGRSSDAQRALGAGSARNLVTRDIVPLLGILLAALLIRSALLLVDAVPFDSDEAIVGLMARHILAGERPIFYYGQSYMGSLDAWLVAGAFALLGPSVAAIRVVQVALFLIHICFVYAAVLGWSRNRFVARNAAFLTAVPTVLLTVYTTVSRGGYVETLLIGDAVLLLGWRLAERKDHPLWLWAMLGLLAGLGWWTLGLIAVYLLPVALLLAVRHRGQAWRGYLIAALCFLAGSAPWWVHNIGAGWEGVRTLYDPVAEAAPSAPVLPVGERILGLAVIGLPSLLGIRMPWLPKWLAGPLIPFVLSAYGVVAWHALRSAIRRSWDGALRLLWGVALCAVSMLIASRFGSDPTGRYLLPLCAIPVVWIALAARALQQRSFWASRALVGAVALLHLWSTLVVATRAPGFTAELDARLQYGNAHDKALGEFLAAHQGTRGYANYWISYKLAFLTQERIILAPSLPYKSDLSGLGGEGRYPPYGEMVRQADSVVYVTGNQPELDVRLRDVFGDLGVEWREHEIGPYRVFYQLTRAVHPHDLQPLWDQGRP